MRKSQGCQSATLGWNWRTLSALGCGPAINRWAVVSSRSLSRTDELAYVFINQCGLLVNDPVGSVRYPLDRQIRNELVESLEVASQQRSVFLTPNNERGHLHLKRSQSRRE